jgi:hypothetical protein
VAARDIHMCFVMPLLAVIKKLFDVWPRNETKILCTHTIMYKTLGHLGADVRKRAKQGVWSETWIVTQTDRGLLDGTGPNDYHICKGVFFPYARFHKLFDRGLRPNPRKAYITEGEKLLLGANINAAVVVVAPIPNARN